MSAVVVGTVVVCDTVVGPEVSFTLVGETVLDALGPTVFEALGETVGFALGEIDFIAEGETVVGVTVGVDDMREKSQVLTKEQALSLQVAEGLQQSELELHPYFGSEPPPFFKPMQVEPTMDLSV